MTNPGQELQLKFNALMLAWQRDTMFPNELPAEFSAWANKGMSFVSIKRSGINPTDFVTMMNKISDYTILDVAHIVSALRTRSLRDMDMSLTEYAYLNQKINEVSAQLDAVIAPKHKE